MDPKTQSRGTMKVLLTIVIAVIVLMGAAFAYWALSSDPVPAPQAPASETTIPGR